MSYIRRRLSYPRIVDGTVGREKQPLGQATGRHEWEQPQDSNLSAPRNVEMAIEGLSAHEKFKKPVDSLLRRNRAFRDSGEKEGPRKRRHFLYLLRHDT